MDQTQKIIVTLSAVLGAVLLASALLFFLLPTATTITPPKATNSTFDTSVFQAPGFLQLDQRPVLDNSLPVPPPSTAGKANPFL